MARYAFASGTVTNTTGAPLALMVFPQAVGGNPVTDVFLPDGSDYPATPVPRGILVTTASGTFPRFLGPEAVSQVWLSPDSGVTRTQVTSTTQAPGDGTGAAYALLGGDNTYSGTQDFTGATVVGLATSGGTLAIASMPAGTTITVIKDPDTGWPARPTSRADIIVRWRGADPSPSIVSSGTGGMRDNVDERIIPA